METNLMESAIPTNFAQILNTQDIDWDYRETDKVYHILFNTMVDVLASMKDPKVKQKCVKIINLKGELLLGAIITFTPNEEEQDQGTWDLAFSIDEKDFDKISCLLSTDMQFQKAFCMNAMHLYSVEIEGPHYVELLCEESCKVLMSWLDENASKKEEVSVILPDIFKADVVVEGDTKETAKKVITITPLDKLTHIIKAD